MFKTDTPIYFLLATILAAVLGIKADLHDSVFNNFLHYTAIAVAVLLGLVIILEKAVNRYERKAKR